MSPEEVDHYFDPHGKKKGRLYEKSKKKRRQYLGSKGY